MSVKSPNPTPHLWTVILTQVRLIGGALHKPALVATGLVLLTTMLVAIEWTDSRAPIAFRPEHYILPAILAVLSPIGIWTKEERFGAGLFWTLPVDRRRHALTRVFAGWIWLMATVALLMAWLLALTVLTGGSVLTEEDRRVLVSATASGGPLDPRELQMVRWGPEPVLWLVPFSGATGAYLFASALTLGARHPVRWIAAAVFGFLLVVSLAEAANAEALIAGSNALLRTFVEGRYGADAVLTARTESLQISATLSNGDVVIVWKALPDVRAWAAATLLWTGAGLVLLWAAASRHREGRRA